jgi:hypothetical protein
VVVILYFGGGDMAKAVHDEIPASDFIRHAAKRTHETKEYQLACIYI